MSSAAILSVYIVMHCCLYPSSSTSFFADKIARFQDWPWVYHRWRSSWRFAAYASQRKRPMTKRIAKQSSIGPKPVDYTKIKIAGVIDFPGTHWPQLSASKQREFYYLVPRHHHPTMLSIDSRSVRIKIKIQALRGKLGMRWCGLQVDLWSTPGNS